MMARPNSAKIRAMVEARPKAPEAHIDRHFKYLTERKGQPQLRIVQKQDSEMEKAG